jgi:lipoprotein-anchoring transpeptidase ErfK/SrfK
MKPVLSQINEILLDAKQALKRGDYKTARRLAEMVVTQAPGVEESWLILAALAEPQESITYLKKALAVNPQSRQARKGMHWAIGRLREQTLPANREKQYFEAESISGSIPVPVTSVFPVINKNSSGPRTNTTHLTKTKTLPDPQGSGRARSWWRFSILPLLLVVACLLAGVWAVWPGNVLPVQAFLRENISRAQVTTSFPAAPVDVLKPTYTATFTPTFTPTPTYTPTPTHTLTPSPTNTPLPTNTPYPTNTPIPLPINEPGTGGERWIDVDLSEQRVYAFEGSTIVNTFVVSTGTWLHPTVVGRFKVYIKLLYADMSGPGYYLPDVPYTMYFYSGYALHGTYWHSNFGVPMSHGCINLSIPDAGWLFNWASVGTIVNVHQ